MDRWLAIFCFAATGALVGIAACAHPLRPPSFLAPLLRWRRRRRLRVEVRLELSTLLDAIALLLEAGIDSLSALSRAAPLCRRRLLRAEWQRLLVELEWGYTLAEGLRRLAARCDVAALAAFAASIAQAERLGTPLAEMLRAHADRLRAERFQQAERRGIVAGQQLIVPLVFCAMPASFLIVFGPLLARWLTMGWEGFLQ